MKPSSFQTTIENQFDYICKRAMEDERKNYMLYLSRIAKREVSFSDVGDYLVSQFATTDNYSTDFQIFTLNGLSVGVENDLLSEALRELPDKKREILLLFYFMDMSDSEIADLLKLNRSTVYRHRTSGLALIKKFMKTQYPMIPFPLIVKATDGDTEAINQILHHYRGYITKRSLRLMKDEYGNQSMVVDEVLRGRMETRLITKILSFEIK